MQDMLISASVVTAIFLIFKLLDNKLRKLKLNGKELIKDLLIVFLSVFGTLYGLNYMKTKKAGTTVFTGEPEF